MLGLSMQKDRVRQPSPVVIIRRGRLDHAFALGAHGAQLDEGEQLWSLLGEQRRRHEEWREELARRLHDQLVQQITSASIELSLARSAGDSESVSEALDRLKSLVEGMIGEARYLRRVVFPEALATLGLGPALLILADTSRRETRLKIETNIQEVVPLTPEVALAAYRMAESAIAGVASRAPEAKVKLTLVPRAQMVELRIEDNGPEWHWLDSAAETRFPWRSAVEPLRAFGGSLSIRSGPKFGTEVVWAVPVKRNVTRGQDDPENPKAPLRRRKKKS